MKEAKLRPRDYQEAAAPLQNGEKRVAIVGAGFAGLTLANYLRSKQRHYQLFESKAEPIPIMGKIRLPSARMVLQELRLLDDPTTSTITHCTASLRCRNDVARDVGNEDDTTCTCSKDIMVEREEFLKLLRRNVNVRYSCRISRVERRPCNSNIQTPKDSRITTRSDDDKTTTTATPTKQEGEKLSSQFYLYTQENTEFGPFDVVVAANGLFIPETISKHAAILGDARWNRWWDFGYQRRTIGGDLAILDGIAFGKLLLADVMETGGETDFVDSPLDRYYLQPRLLSLPAMKMFFMPIVLAIIYAFIQTFEKI